MKDPLLIVIDLFCGFGGTTRGYELAELDGYGIALVFACVNHDPKAIKSHWLNHPDVHHFEEDIRTLDLTPLVALTRKMRARYPNAKLVLWASMECTNFSKAKAGMPRNADSRTLADHIPRYLDALDVDYFKYENVVEFMSWGPLDDKGKPVSRKSGEDWLRWIAEIEGRGFSHDWRQLNSANFGAYTSRNRLFGIFSKAHLPVAWPQPTHAKNPSIGMHGGLRKWMPVKDVLNFEDEGESILDREKPLVDATLERIYAGLVKFVAKGLVKYNSKSKDGSYKPPSTEEPAPVITTQNRLYLAQAAFLSKYYSGDPSRKITSIDEPAGTLRTKDGQALMRTEFLQIHNGKSKVRSVDELCPTIAPGPTIIARQDKTPLYLIQVQEGPVVVAVYGIDSPVMVRIKQFMAAYGIVDIKMRMLRVPELLRIQGFPDTYKMVGNQSDQKKFIGNSVHPKVPKAWAEAMGIKLLENRQKVA